MVGKISRKVPTPKKIIFDFKGKRKREKDFLVWKRKAKIRENHQEI
jgi:hypothetical protein